MKVEGKMTAKECKDYLRGLKIFISSHGVSDIEKLKLEDEISQWETICKVADRISFM